MLQEAGSTGCEGRAVVKRGPKPKIFGAVAAILGGVGPLSG